MASSYVLTNNGLKIAIDRFTNSSPTRTALSKFQVGIGTTAAAFTDSALGNSVPITGIEQVDACDVTTGWTDSADCTLSVNSTTYLQGSGSLNITKDGSASTTCSTYKTTTSLSFASKILAVWLYIKDTTTLNKLEATGTAVAVNFGNDGSNNWRWNFLKSELSTGWNYLGSLSPSNADTTTGSPSTAACDYTAISIYSANTSDTWSDGDLIFDNIFLAEAADYYKTVESSYPSADYTNYEVTYRSRITSTQCNGHNLTEVGLANTDGTILLGTRGTFNPVSKSNTDELIIQEIISFDNR